MKIFDSHAHILFPKLKNRLKEILLNALENNIHYIMNLALGPEIKNLTGALRLLELDGIALTAGTHPHDAKNHNPAYDEVLTENIARISAVGEIGLDYHYDLSPRDIQQKVLEQQIDLANQLDKPIVMHIREAHDDAIAILKNNPPVKPAIIHCFTADAKTAVQYLDMGFFISYSGVLTFPKSEDVRKAAALTPHDRYLVETDSPYLAPVPKRGKTCEPAFTFHTLNKLAEVKNTDIEKAATHATENTFRAFMLPDDFKPLNSEQINRFDFSNL